MEGESEEDDDIGSDEKPVNSKNRRKIRGLRNRNKDSNANEKRNRNGKKASKRGAKPGRRIRSKSKDDKLDDIKKCKDKNDSSIDWDDTNVCILFCSVLFCLLCV